MNSFALHLAWREARTGLRRIGLYGLSISLGVAALVSVHSFRDDVNASIREQARELMGADVRFEADQPLPDFVDALVDSVLQADGGRRASLVSAGSMVLAPSSGVVRLLQIRGVEGGWPLYGEVATQPANAWSRLGEPGVAVVDAAVLTQLEVRVGESIVVGGDTVRIVASVADLPSGLGFQTALGPRVWLGRSSLEAAGLLGFGSLARYEAFVASPSPERLAALEERYERVLDEAQVDIDTADDQADQLTRGVRVLGDFLGLVGLGALLLGGVGVASAIHVFVKERLAQVAVLRCLGARQSAVFTAYLLQAAALGLVGAVVGAAVGVGIQQLLPALLAGVVPVDIEARIWWGTIAAGVGMGVWVSALFALLPLLEVRDVPPLRALRHSIDAKGGTRERWPHRLAVVALVASVAALAVVEAPDAVTGLGFSASLVLVAAVLGLIGRAVIVLARRTLPAGAPYVVRQGYSNLFRPANQTVAVTLALGFGGFIVATVLQLGHNLERELALDLEAGQPDALLFDIQRDQVQSVRGLLPDPEAVEITPIVQARLSEVRGVPVAELLARPAGERPPGWVLTREYRHTWRDTLTVAEELVEGAWWPASVSSDPDVVRVSVEADFASDLGVGLGDELTWLVAGRSIRSTISSLRVVDWERFQTNFFVVFEPGVLEQAPATFVALARLGSDAAIVDFQRELIGLHPNVSVLDISRVRETLEGLLARVTRAIAFLAGFSSLAGLVVLAGALAATRHQRLREGALLQTLGARQRQVLEVFLVEYLALGSVAAISGLVLAVFASWALITLVFGFAYQPDLKLLLLVWAGVASLTVLTGWVGVRGVLRRPPLQVLRELTG